MGYIAGQQFQCLSSEHWPSVQRLTHEGSRNRRLDTDKYTISVIIWHKITRVPPSVTLYTKYSPSSIYYLIQCHIICVCGTRIVLLHWRMHSFLYYKRNVIILLSFRVSVEYIGNYLYFICTLCTSSNFPFNLYDGFDTSIFHSNYIFIYCIFVETNFRQMLCSPTYIFVWTCLL